MDSTILGWVLLLPVGTTALVMLLSLVAQLVPPVKEAVKTQRREVNPEPADESRPIGHRNTLLHFVPRIYIAFNRRREGIQWISLRYTYVTIFLLWIIGPALLLTFESLFLLGLGSSQLIELLGEATFYEVYGNDPADFWVPVGFGTLSLLLLLLSCISLGRSGRRLFSAKNYRPQFPLDVGQWPREFASPVLWLIVWAWIVLTWTSILLFTLALYALGNIGG